MNDILLQETIDKLHEAVYKAVKNKKEECVVSKDTIRIARDFLEIYKFEKKRHATTNT